MRFYQIKKLFYSKGNNQQCDDMGYRMQKIFASSAADRALITRTYKEVKSVNNKRTSNAINK
jgi:hypothetical protein